MKNLIKINFGKEEKKEIKKLSDFKEVKNKTIIAKKLKPFEEKEEIEDKISSSLFKKEEPEEKEVEIKINESSILKRCPKCNSRIGKGKLITEENYIHQLFKCKNRDCDFVKEMRFNI